MPFIEITAVPGFQEWRSAARCCLLAGIAPQNVIWQNPKMPSLFTLDEPLIHIQSPAPTVPQDFLKMAELAACHRDPNRFALLYHLLWRLVHENRSLLHYQTDTDVLALRQLVKAVHRDAYKIKAFLRFRSIEDRDGECFVSWYEPEHYSLELSLPFFQERFHNIRWSILTPYRAAHWDGTTLTLSDSPDPTLYPQRDEVERYWLDYYESIFNPARLKQKAMFTQMPKKYWKNMPETVLVEKMIHNTPKLVREMLARQSAVEYASGSASPNGGGE